MPTEARVTRVWKNQRLFLFIFFLAFAGAFFFDGLIRYPRLNKQLAVQREFVGQVNPKDTSEELRAWAKAAHEEFIAKNPGKNWEDFAKERGWSETPPEKIHSEVEQYIFGGFMCLLAVIALAYWFMHKGRRLRTENDVVLTPSGKSVPFSAITGLGKKNWEAKGLATVKYELNGQRGQFVVDDYKFEYDPSHAILQEIEDHLVARSGGKPS